MHELIDGIAENKELMLVLTGTSLAMFVGSLLAVPWLIARAPRDIFTHNGYPGRQHTLPFKLLKNVAGVVLLFAGFLMLFLPGQGLLTLIVGVALLDIPGKHALLVRIARRPHVQRALNYIRRRAHKEPFDPPR